MSKQELIKALASKSPEENVTIVKNEAKPIPGVGPGRIANLETPIR